MVASSRVFSFSGEFPFEYCIDDGDVLLMEISSNLKKLRIRGIKNVVENFAEKPLPLAFSYFSCFEFVIQESK